MMKGEAREVLGAVEIALENLWSVDFTVIRTNLILGVSNPSNSMPSYSNWTRKGKLNEKAKSDILVFRCIVMSAGSERGNV